MSAALALIVSSCSQTEAPAPVVITKLAHAEVPPEARKECPALTPKPSKAMTDAEIFEGWASDRTARNICEVRRRAAVAAADAMGKPQ